jgi:hypothetical protein
MKDNIKDNRQTDKGAIRLFFFDKKTGHPVVGIAVNISVESDKNQSQLLVNLQTDQAGYASFKFDRSIITVNSQLRITHGASQTDALVVKVEDLLAGKDTYTIRFDTSNITINPALGLPSVLSPDIVDLTLSPSSIGLIPHLSRGGGLCSQLMPTTLTIRRFKALLIRADICHPETLSCSREGIQFVKGKMLEYEIAWHPAGTALGELLNTISLAPCEQVNVAIVDWTRRETATLNQTSDINQQASQQMDHDRLINETMQSSVKSKTLAGAVGITSGVKAAIPIKVGNLDLTAGFGAGFSGSISTQTVAANTTNQLSERITQASSFVASQRNSSVFQATANEHQTYQTRTVRNHNHCHTLTLMYYQVNTNYKVVTDYKGERDVILVKYNNKDFDAERAYCNAEVLKDALLDRSLLSCFDELAPALFCCDKKPAGKGVLMDSLTLTINLANEVGAPHLQQLTLNTINGQMNLGGGGLLQAGINTQTFNLPGQVDPEQVTSIVLFFSTGGGMGGSKFNVALNIEVTYHAVGYPDPFKLSSINTSTFLKDIVFMEAKAELPPTKEGLNPCVEASCCIKKLLGHLNCHKRYYNSLVWLNEDPNERVMRWSCCFKGNEPFSLIDQIENDPIAVYGDFLVFAVFGSQLVDDPSILPISKLVTLPTPGVYSEGILGQCNTCEKIDPDIFWNWKDSPCPDNAPSLSDPPTPKPGVNLSDLKPDAITSLITFATVPDAPDSAIKDLITTLLANADKGSEEAKALLEKLLDAIKASIPTSSDKSE